MRLTYRKRSTGQESNAQLLPLLSFASPPNTTARASLQVETAITFPSTSCCLLSLRLSLFFSSSSSQHPLSPQLHNLALCAIFEETQGSKPSSPHQLNYQNLPFREFLPLLNPPPLPCVTALHNLTSVFYFALISRDLKINDEWNMIF